MSSGYDARDLQVRRLFPSVGIRDEMIMTIDTKALQKKLETFVGFKENRFNEPPHEVAWIEDAEGHMFTDGVPDLVNSLDAQAKYKYYR